MADAADSKSAVGDYVWVQVPSPAFQNPLFTCFIRVLENQNHEKEGEFFHEWHQACK